MLSFSTCVFAKFSDITQGCKTRSTLVTHTVAQQRVWTLITFGKHSDYRWIWKGFVSTKSPRVYVPHKSSYRFEFYCTNQSETFQKEFPIRLSLGHFPNSPLESNLHNLSHIPFLENLACPETQQGYPCTTWLHASHCWFTQEWISEPKQPSRISF